MANETSSRRLESNAYDIFILVLTIISLVIIVVMFLPFSDETIRLLQVYDNLICVVFLIDFFYNLRKASKKSAYFIKERGWLDLLGAVPSLGIFFKYARLLRLARLNRLARIARQLGRRQRGDLLRDIVQNRSHYTALVTVLLTIVVLTTASVLVLQFESSVSGSNIKTGWEALWYSMVTLTTVGYGDYYPVTTEGRITGMFIMVTGIGIIGALASILVSLLLGSTSTSPVEEKPGRTSEPAVEQELMAIKDELVSLRQLIERMSLEGDQKQSSNHLADSRSKSTGVFND